MSSTASAAVLSHMVPTWSGPEPAGPGLHDDVDHDHLHARVVFAHVSRPAQLRSWAAVVVGSAPAILFVREFLLRMGREYGQSADTYLLAECASGDDEGGPLSTAIANPREAGIPADERATPLHSFNLRKRRSANLFAFLLQHIIQPELRAMLEENAKVNGVMVRDGQVAWEKLRLHCYREPNDLTIMAMDKEWNDAGFKSVGLSINTINDMLVYLANLNGARPTASKKTESEIVVKLLSCFESFDPSTNLGMTAITEHAAPKSERKFWRPAVAAAGAAGASPASRDFQGVQLFFDPLWRVVYSRTQDGTRGHQADGAMRVGEGSDEDDEAYYTAGGAGGRSRPRAHGGPGDRPVRGDDRLVGKTLTLKQCHEMNIQRCYACQGHGHVSCDCGNRAGIKINIETNVSLLGDAQRAASGHSASGARPRAADGGAARSTSRAPSAQASSLSARGPSTRADRSRGAPPARSTRSRTAYMADDELGFDNGECDGEYTEFSDDGGDFDDEAHFVADDYESDFGGSGFVSEAFACGVCETPPPAAVAAPRVARCGFLEHIKQCLEGAFA